MEKATHEAKLATSWLAPDADYDQAVRSFVTEVFIDDDVMSEVATFVDAIEPYARANSLSQKLVQLTMPGVPDTYQGCELPAFTLVDPDNRGAVDFDARRAAVQTLLDEKLRLTAVALRLRRDHPTWFDSYEPDHRIGPGGRPCDRVQPITRGRRRSDEVLAPASSEAAAGVTPWSSCPKVPCRATRGSTH